MTTCKTTRMPTRVATRRRSPRTPILREPLTETRTEAGRLIADLLALVDAGLVTATTDPGSAARYAIVDELTNPAS